MSHADYISPSSPTRRVDTAHKKNAGSPGEKSAFRPYILLHAAVTRHMSAISPKSLPLGFHRSPAAPPLLAPVAAGRSGPSRRRQYISPLRWQNLPGVRIMHTAGRHRDYREELIAFLPLSHILFCFAILHSLSIGTVEISRSARGTIRARSFRFRPAMIGRC